jgi:hypothetical protein
MPERPPLREAFPPREWTERERESAEREIIALIHKFLRGSEGAISNQAKAFRAQNAVDPDTEELLMEISASAAELATLLLVAIRKHT